MATFYGGTVPMLHAVAESTKDVENDDVDIHTITLILDGRHGEFNLVVEATDMTTMEERRWEGIAHRSGGVSGFGEVKV